MNSVVALLGMKIGDRMNTEWPGQVDRFFHFSDPSLVTSLLGCMLLGIVLSLLGSFMVLRKMSLLGDTLGHAVLPGICIAFLFTGTKALIPTLAGAVLSGVAGVLLMGWIVSASRIKTDAAMGMILSSFFGLGIVLLTHIQKQGSGSQSGLDKFLFGQAAALNTADVWALGVITTVTLLVLFLFLKELTVVTFDEGYAKAVGLPTGFIRNLLMILTTVAVVASIQAVGVVLVSAMLIIPAATAWLWVKRIPTLLILSAFFGLFSGFAGAFLSFLGPSLPTGPFMVVAAAFLFAVAFLFAPRHGLVCSLWRRWARRHRTQRENVLKSVYRLFEQEGFKAKAVTLQALAAFRNETVHDIRRRIADLGRRKWILRDGEWIAFTPRGGELARQLVRRHRLWELFLVKEAQLPPDHVHVDAEEIEHVLPPEVIAELEASLEHARLDPHGKPIP